MDSQKLRDDHFTRLHYHEERTFSNPKDKGFFKRFVEQKRKEIQPPDTASVTTRMLAAHLGMQYDPFRVIVNMKRPTKNRDLIIAICVSIYANSAETDDALESYNNMPRLDPDDPRESIITNYLEENLGNNSGGVLQSLDEINKELENAELPLLDILDRRSSRKPFKPQYPLPVLKKWSETNTDELLYGDPYNSLDSCYSPRGYHVSASMMLGNNEAARYTLTATQNGDFFLKDYAKKDGWIPQKQNLEEAGPFRDCFIELLNMSRVELKKMLDVLNDTKNYHQRESAKIIDGALHVFTETFNYVIPELNEYYLMDYSKGQYTLYIFGKSQFMRYYLSPARYSELYGRAKTTPKAVFPSIESIHAERDSAPPRQKEIYKVHERAFSDLQREVNSLIEALRRGEKHICNVNYVFEHDGEMLERLNIAERFDCSYDEEFGAISRIGTDRALFEAENGEQIELTVEDISDGFSLGLYTIDEIVDFRLHHDSLKITDLL